MANIFSFSLDESFLRNYAAYLQQLREGNPGKTFKVVISVDLIPDGVGYEVSGSPMIAVEEVPEEEEPHA